MGARDRLDGPGCEEDFAVGARVRLERLVEGTRLVEDKPGRFMLSALEQGAGVHSQGSTPLASLVVRLRRARCSWPWTHRGVLLWSTTVARLTS